MKPILPSLTYLVPLLAGLAVSAANAAGPAPEQRTDQSAIVARVLPLQLSEALQRAWSSNLDIERADMAVQGANLAYRARQAAFYMPRLDLGVQTGKQRAPGYGQQAAGLPLDVTATLNGQPVDRATLLNIFSGAQSLPLGMILYQNGTVTTLAALIAAQTSSYNLESATPTSYANSYQSGLNLSLSYSLYSGGSDQRAIERAQLQQHLAEIEVLALKRKVALDVITAYVNLRQAWQQAEQDQALLLQEQGRRETRTKAFDSGAIARNDVFRSDLDYGLQRIRAEKSAAQRAQTQQAYCEVLHQSSCVAPAQWPEPEAMPATLTSVAAQWQTSQMGKSDANRAIQNLALAEAKSAYLPRVSISASSSMSGVSSSSFKDSLDQFKYRGWQVGVSLNWNLFDGFQSTFGVAAAKLAQQDADADTAQQVASSRQEQAGAAKQVASLAQEEARINVSLAHLKLEETQIKERLGRSTKDELQIAQQADHAAQLALAFQEWEQRRAIWSEALLPCSATGSQQAGCGAAVKAMGREAGK